jgi:hypothetical protein
MELNIQVETVRFLELSDTQAPYKPIRFLGIGQTARALRSRSVQTNCRRLV